MPVRALIIAIESYPELADGLAEDLPGTIETARGFRNWLMETKGVKPEDIYFCAHPPVAGESCYAAKRDDIRDAILKLRDAGKNDETPELYVFFSGHGYAQKGPNGAATATCLLAADYRDLDSLDRAIDQAEIVDLLRKVMGPGTHFHFIDACREALNEEDFNVSGLAIPKKARSTGQAKSHVLFSTSIGALAKVNPQFGSALLDGLAGRGRAKHWLGKNLVVNFTSLKDYVITKVKSQKPEVGTNDDSPGLIREFSKPVPQMRCEVRIKGAAEDDKFFLELSDVRERPIKDPMPFEGTYYDFKEPPDDYLLTLRSDTGMKLAEREVDLYEDATVEFQLGVLERTGVEGLELESFTKAIDGGDPAACSEPDGVTLTEFQPREDSGLNDLLKLDELKKNPPVKLALLGAAGIVGREDGREFLDYLRKFSPSGLGAVPAGGSALAVRMDVETEASQLRVGVATYENPMEVEWRQLEASADGNVCRIELEIPCGPRLISIAFGKVSVVTLATIFLPNRATSITVTGRKEEALQIHQMMLPMAHLIGEMPGYVRQALSYRGGADKRLEDISFMVEAQQVFERRGELRKLDEWRLKYLLYGKWLDPIMAVMASYELIRRGQTGGLLAEALWNLRHYFSELPDTAALSILASGEVGKPGGLPVFLEGLDAFEDDEGRLKLPLPESRLDRSGIWTLWRGAVPPPQT